MSGTWAVGLPTEPSGKRRAHDPTLPAGGPVLLSRDEPPGADSGELCGQTEVSSKSRLVTLVTWIPRAASLRSRRRSSSKARGVA